MPATIQHSLTMTSPDDPLYENQPKHWNSAHAISLALQASEFKYVTLNTGAQYDDGQEVHDLTRSAGHLDGGDITDAGSGNIAVTAGQGFIRATADDTSTLYTFAWAAPANIAIPSNTIRYVRVDYNAGSPVVTVSASEDYDYRTGFPLGFVINEGGTLYINETPHSTGRGIGRLSRRNYEVDGRSRAHALGGLILSESGTAKTMALTSGVTWLRGLRDIVAAFDSNAGGTFDRYYRAATPPDFTKEATQTVVPDGLWDDGTGTPPTIGNNNYANYWFYLGPSSAVVMVYGRGNFNSLAAAQVESPPDTLPLRLQVGSLLLGRFILRRTGGSSYNVVLVESAFTQTFQGSGVSDHGLLSGLADDDHPQYHLTANGVIRQVSAGTQAVTSGSVSFGNANGVSFGLNANTLTASHNALTSQSNQAASAANGSFAFQTLSFSNVNNVSFVTAAGSAIQASVPAGVTATGNLGAVAGSNTTYTSGTVVFSGVGGGATISSAAGRIDVSVAAPVVQSNQNVTAANGGFAFQTLSFSNLNGISFGTSAGSAITASHNALTTAALSDHSHGASGQNGSFGFQTLSFSNANGISFGTSAGNAITASIAAGGAPGSVSAGTTDFALGKVIFSDLNGVTFGLDGATITASVAAGGGDAIRGIAAGGATISTSTVNFSNSNGVSFGFGAAGNSTVMTASHNALTSQSNQNALAANGNFNFQTISFSNVNGISFATAAGSAMQGSVIAQAQATTISVVSASNVIGTRTTRFALEDHQHQGVHGLVAQGVASTWVGDISLSGANNITINTVGNTSGGTIQISGQSNPAISAAGNSVSLGTIVFSNSNGVSFGMAGSTVTATVTPGAAAGIGAIAVNALTTYTSGTVVFSNANGVTFGTNAQTITASVNAGGGGFTYPGLSPYDEHDQVTGATGQGSLILDPQPLPNVSFDRIVFFVNNTNSSNSSGQHTLRFSFGMYTRNGASLSLYTSWARSTGLTHSGTDGSYSLFSGQRGFHITFAATSIPENRYWLAFVSSTSTGVANGSYSHFVCSNLVTNYIGLFGGVTGTSNQPRLGQGYYSATTTALPGSIAFSQINGTGFNAKRAVIIGFGSSTA